MLDPSGNHTVQNLCDKYLIFAEQSFKHTRNGDLSPNWQRLNLAISFLKPFMSWPLKSFGSDELRKVQQELITYRYRQGRKPKDEPTPVAREAPATKALTRQSINDHIDELRKMWSWGVGRGMVQHQHERALKEVKTLRRGHEGTAEGTRRKPISKEEFDKAIASAPNRTLADMMLTMWYAELRPTEVCEMRPVDFDMTHEDCWLFVPGRDQFLMGKHKTMHHDLPRAVPVTKRLQAILKPRIDAAASSTAFIFSPKVAMDETREKRFAERKTPISCGNRPGTNRQEHAMISPRDKYDHKTFCRAVRRTFDRAGLPPATPYDIRRSTITRIRAIAGKEVAALLTGHTTTKTTDIYLLDEVREAMKAAKEIDEKL